MESNDSGRTKNSIGSPCGVVSPAKRSWSRVKKFKPVLTLLIFMFCAQALCPAQVTIAQDPVPNRSGGMSGIKEAPDVNPLFDESFTNDIARINPTGVVIRDYRKGAPKTSGPLTKHAWKISLFVGEMSAAGALVFGVLAWGTRIYRQARSRAIMSGNALVRRRSRGMTPPLVVRRVRSRRRRLRAHTT